MSSHQNAPGYAQDCAVVGMGATVMDGAVVEAGAIVGAGALVPPGATIPANQIWAGSPAKFIRELAEGESRELGYAALLRPLLPDVGVDALRAGAGNWAGSDSGHSSSGSWQGVGCSWCAGTPKSCPQ